MHKPTESRSSANPKENKLKEIHDQTYHNQTIKTRHTKFWKQQKLPIGDKPCERFGFLTWNPGSKAEVTPHCSRARRRELSAQKCVSRENTCRNKDNMMMFSAGGKLGRCVASRTTLR